MDVMRAIQACNPQSKYFLSPPVLKPLVEMYNLDIEVVEMEAKLAKRTLERALERTLEQKELECTSDAFLSLIPVKDTFPQLTKLLRIAMTIAVSTAHCERSFSTLKRIKSYLRSTMGEDKLADLAILSIER